MSSTIDIDMQAARIAELEVENDRFRVVLENYASDFCEQGSLKDYSCGTFSIVDCNGCQARAVLNFRKV